jgi:hypothetical protein
VKPASHRRRTSSGAASLHRLYRSQLSESSTQTVSRSTWHLRSELPVTTTCCELIRVSTTSTDSARSHYRVQARDMGKSRDRHFATVCNDATRLRARSSCNRNLSRRVVELVWNLLHQCIATRSLIEYFAVAARSTNDSSDGASVRVSASHVVRRALFDPNTKRSRPLCSRCVDVRKRVVLSRGKNKWHIPPNRGPSPALA